MKESMSCPLCSCNHVKFLYESRGSKIGLRIHICDKCEHVFASRASKAKKPLETVGVKIQNISCDADYSEVRVGKQQMTDIDADRLLEFLSKNRNIKSEYILDSCSARGHFLKKISPYLPGSHISGIEPDAYMAESYKNDKRFDVFVGEVEDFSSAYKYDIIYSCHSLEHYSDPKKIFDFVISNLDKKGIFFINVPNLEFLDYYSGMDEYFYDYHLQYFHLKTLNRLADMYGFRPLQVFSDSSLGVIYTRNASSNEVETNSPSKFNPVEAINNYITRLNYHQGAVSSAAENIKKIVEEVKQNIVFFGAGRVLDFFVKYGSLDLQSEKIMLVDNFLSNGTDSLYGKKLIPFDKLNPSTVDTWIVFSNTSSETITNLITSKSKSPMYNAIDLIK